MSGDERLGSASRAQLAGQLALAGGRMTLDRVDAARGGGDKDHSVVAGASALQAMLEMGIARAFPDDSIVTAEDQLTGGFPRGRYTWMVVDAGGRDDLESRLPGCSVSVGVLRDRIPFAGAVYDPVTRRLFTACVGRGAWLNDRPLYAGHSRVPARPFLAVDAFVNRGVRPWRGVDGRYRFGSTALRLCYVALGGLDLVREVRVSLMDIAGAAPIVTEAGGMLTSEAGAPLFPEWPASALSAPVAILAGSPVSHERALRELPLAR